MKLKRSKAYKKLVSTYSKSFGLRPPFQVVVSADIVETAFHQKIPLPERLSKVLGGPVKCQITQCEMRKLYNQKPKSEALIRHAKEYERRRCGHHELEEPLSTLECLSSVVDPKENYINKHHLLIATQDSKVRAYFRQIPGTPLLYLSKSVLILEPMAVSSEQARETQEKSKFKLGLAKGRRDANSGQKRKRDDEAEDLENQSAEEVAPQKKKRAKGPKGPNPLSVKKPKKAQAEPQTHDDTAATKSRSSAPKETKPLEVGASEATVPDGETTGHHKRKRKHKPKGNGAAGDTPDGATAVLS